MQRIGMIVGVRPELIEEYKEYHRSVWPEIEEILHRVGFRNLSIYFHGNVMFMYHEYVGERPIEEARDEYAASEKTQEWEALMGKYQVPLPDSPEGVRWVPMDELYHLD